MGEGQKRESGNRFERVWNEWDEAVDAGKSPKDLLADLGNEKILQLLAGAGSERRYERDVLATEVANRLLKTRQELTRAAEDVSELVKEVEAKGDEVRDKVHDTEEVVARLQGSEKLGAKTPQEITAHHGSTLVEHLMDMLGRAETALERLEDARRRDVERSGSQVTDKDPDS